MDVCWVHYLALGKNDISAIIASTNVFKSPYIGTDPTGKIKQI